MKILSAYDFVKNVLFHKFTKEFVNPVLVYLWFMIYGLWKRGRDKMIVQELS